MIDYRLAVNFEWTSKCNARCVMCPQERIDSPRLISDRHFERALDRINGHDVFRTVIAGYGEPTTHPHFDRYVDSVGAHPTSFDMVTNGMLLSEARLRNLDGKLGLLVISFSSIEPDVYRRVHVNLDHERVKENIAAAARILTTTQVAISLTPLTECLATLPQTVGWLRAQGIELLTMSPTLYNRAGNMTEHQTSSQRLRGLIRDYGLHSQELDFIPSIMEVAAQNLASRFRCIPRNSDLFITASGEYLYCYNDISHRHTIGSVDDLSIRDAIEIRAEAGPIEEICAACNMRSRYGIGELIGVARDLIRPPRPPLDDAAIAVKPATGDIPATLQRRSPACNMDA